MGKVDFKPWVVVSNAGTDMECEEAEFRLYESACVYGASLSGNNLENDVMKRLPDGSLTTDF